MEVRVLVSFDGRHHAYGDAITRAIEDYRPHLDVSVAGTGGFAAEASRLRPDLVISDRSKDAGVARGVVPAWVELPTGPDPVSRICVGGRFRRSRNPSFAELLSVVDEAEGLTGTPTRRGVE